MRAHARVCARSAAVRSGAASATLTRGFGMTAWGRFLLRLDAAGALLAGATVLALRGWLGELYGVEDQVIVGVALANLGYGTFSGALNVLWATGVGRRGPLLVLAAANLAWPVVCAALLATVPASPFGQAHFVMEGLYVGALGWAEWRAWSPLTR